MNIHQDYSVNDTAKTSANITRSTANEKGLSRFFTGRPCKSGHICERYVSNKQCVKCNAEKARERETKKCAFDPSYRMHRSVQRRSGQVLGGRASASQALSCGHMKLKKYIEAKFSDGMQWSNYGQWEIDHIIPLSKGDCLEEIIFLCHYSNLQPLWKRDNQVKGDKF